MATIADNLNTLQVIKLDIKNAINSKGGSANDDFRTYANAIEELPSGGGDDTLKGLIQRDITSINIPQGTTSIGDYAFYGCSSITSIEIPNSVTSIGQFVFSGCTSLTNITISDSVTSIGSYAFNRCSNLTNVTIPNHLTVLNDHLFQYASGITRINSEIDEVINIPNNVTRIKDSCFWDLRKIKQVNFPNTLDVLEQNAFYSCSGLTSIDIPQSVRDLGIQNTFGLNKSLSNIYCHWMIPPRGNVFSGSYTGGTLHIPNGASQYYRNKWSGTTALFGSTLHWNIVEDQGDYEPINVLVAKYNVTSSTSATKIFGNTNRFASGATSASTGCTIWIEETPSMYSGSGYTFASVGEKEIRIDNCPSTIPINAFQYCSSLTSVTIPDSVIRFDNDVFYGCSSLTNINYNGAKSQFTSISKGNNWKLNVPTTCIVHCTDGDYPITDFS